MLNFSTPRKVRQIMNELAELTKLNDAYENNLEITVNGL